MPAGQVITRLSDRAGRSMSNCFTPCARSGGTFACGYQPTPWSISRPSIFLLSETCVHPALEKRFFQKVSILGAALGPVSLAVACLLEQRDDRLHRGE